MKENLKKKKEKEKRRERAFDRELLCTCTVNYPGLEHARLSCASCCMSVLGS